MAGTLIMPDGTEHGMTLIGDTTSDQDISLDTDTAVQVTVLTTTTSHVSITEPDTAQDLTEYLQAQVHFAEEAA